MRGVWVRLLALFSFIYFGAGEGGGGDDPGPGTSLGYSIRQNYVFPQLASWNRSARLRHSRRSEKLYLDYTNVQENHKPVFAGCSNYRPNVKEEADPGTFVFQVKANDIDPIENGGNITYKVVSSPGEKLKFDIDQYTGKITTKHVFDRDEPDREKFVYLTVRATDNGRPQLDDVCTIKVAIEDINDNPPVFDKASYKESVPQDLIPGQVVMRISATDIDDGNNSIVIYSLQSKSDDTYGDYFRIDNKTGLIYLNRPIDRHPGQVFNLKATATDQGEKKNSNTIELTIVVVESNKKAPVFVKTPASPIILLENLTDYTYHIATLTAESNDENAPLFELLTGRTEQTNKYNTFRLESDGNTARIVLATRMDYESVPEYMLTVRIQNKHNLAAETSMKIQLEDVNDNVPAFTEVLSGVVLENKPLGTPVMQVRAIDADGTSAHNQVIYELADNNENFAIDPNTGNIITKKIFDKKTQDFYNVKVIARDNSPSALDQTDEPNHGVQVLRIEIASNNEPPAKFTESIYKKSLNNYTDHVFPQLATRNRRSPARLRHSRHSDKMYSSYSDYIEHTNVQENHKPVFTGCSNYRPTVKEEADRGTFVFQVKANDIDPLDNGGNITYTFVSSPGERLKFNIDHYTGNITTNHEFDRDEPNREKVVYLTVRATDNGRPQLDDVCTIKITIEDINDNSPVFDKVSYKESVPQDLIPGREVMRISATDIDDGNNSIVVYSLESKSDDSYKDYFRIDNKTGVIFLNRAIDRDPGQVFNLKATATDQGEEKNNATMNLDIVVVESNKKAPVFIKIPASPIILLENLTDFSYHIATLTAESNDENAPLFELVTGRTEQTNKDNTFRLESDGNTAHIVLARRMDYESVSEYMLTIRIQNKYNLAAETSIKIQLEDVNDNIPGFTEVLSGVVLENEPPGTPVMQVRAIDADSTSAHNQVTYELADNTDNFAIDPKTGNITTRKKFDRETQDFYNVKVIARDNSPSALYKTGEPNHGEQVFRIEIADKNDHPPKFTEQTYVAEAIPEDANINARVTQVNALDNDTASPVTYSIVEGNEGEAFTIDDKTGEIRVNNQLDYENKTNYILGVRAFDGVYEDTCTVIIKIENVNDNRPVFIPYPNNITIEEEEPFPGCVAQVEAYDPDLQNRSVDQHIVYFVVKEEQKKLLKINKTGCLSLVKPLDRDPPNGFEIWQVLIAADDEDGGRTSLRESTEVIITLTDINDNEPFLDMPQPVIWRENQPPGVITKLVAKDNDGPENGPPFNFYISHSASTDIQSKFSINSGDSTLRALVTFDREEKKSYNIPISITDSGRPTRTGTSTLVVVIGDENDNPMESGYSEIFVYNYKGEAPDFSIGRVYVKDLDDWDLPDKSFYWAQPTPNNFELDQKTGMITMLQGTVDQSYSLKFTVFENSRKFRTHNVTAVVNVTVKEIPEEAVDKSGSIRLGGITAEEFVEPDSNGVSKRTQFRKYLAKFLNVSEENVDIFTILHSPHNTNMTQLDVRFSAHGSPYHSPEKLNAAVSVHSAELEKELGITIIMVNIDECLIEKQYCEGSCINFLNKSPRPSPVYTNTTTFVGVRAVVDPFCKCEFQVRPLCYNGGTLVHDEQCECLPGFEGPRCEILSIGFNGDGWALYPSLESCADSHLSLIVQSNKKDGLLFYAGPTRPDRFLHVQDFISLEIRDGYPLLLLDFGTGTIKLNPETIRLDDGQYHRIDVIWSRTTIELQVDNCKLPSCLSLKLAEGPNEFLNVNGPLQLGGSFVEFNYLHKHMNWTFKPSRIPFSGCIRNFTFNSKLYNLGAPGYAKNADIGCNTGVAVAVSFGLDPSFLIAILICLAILLMLLLAVVVHRRKTDDLYKDTDDIRENIINYEDEGGGEGDMTAYDLNVLRLMYNDTIQDKHHTDHPNQRSDEVPDISGFLHGKKQSVDNDPETNPFDDVRHYAYEGDGNTSGSLSSLASGTDEGDLNFDYLSNFGPRFRKLADMYGEDPSDDDDDDDNYQNTASESWC